jgi:ABC-2 type transport system permease protein
MKQRLKNIYLLGIKELHSLWQDKIMLFLIIYSFTFAVYIKATSASTELHKVPIAFVDEDRSTLSMRIMDAFYRPRFLPPEMVSAEAADAGMDEGIYTFIITIPPAFEKKVLQGRHPALQLNIDATRMSQAGIGAGYIQQMVSDEVLDFLHGHKSQTEMPVEVVTRMKFNPTLDSTWFGGVMEVISQISLLSIILSGAALIREREHGTLEHLLVMPLGATEIMLSKVWSMGLVVLIGTALSLELVVEKVLAVPIAGSVPLFLFGALLMLFSTTSMGIFMGTVARTMPQLGLIIILTILPLQILSGNVTPFESMPVALQKVMLLMPTSHFVTMAQGVLYRGAGVDIVWPQLLAISGIGVVFFLLGLLFFRRSLAKAS